MSLKTWKEEFYPIPADEVKKKDALAHSLRKWEGLRKAQLDKHGLVRRRCEIAEDDSFFVPHLAIAAETCALCVLAEKESDVNTRVPCASSYYCGKCPLYQLEGKACDYGENDPYGIFTCEGNPEPMISLITRAIEEKAKVSEKRRASREDKKNANQSELPQVIPNNPHP